MNRHVTKDNIWMRNKYTKKRSTPLVNREMQIKTMKRYHYLPIRLTKIEKKHTLPKVEVKDAESLTLIHCGRGFQNGTATLDTSWAIP